MKSCVSLVRIFVFISVLSCNLQSGLYVCIALFAPDSHPGREDIRGCTHGAAKVTGPQG